MIPRRHMAREISYSHAAATPGGRAIIRIAENATGRLRLIRRAQGYEDEVAAGRCFWAAMARRYGLSVELIGGSLASIPTDGPLVVIANHPYGILDGLILGQILSAVRGDFRLLAHQVFRKAEELNRIILPISFDETKDARKLNIETRKKALSYLADGGAIGIFPGGTVSTARRPFSTAMDPRWRAFTARMLAKSHARVVAIYFEGQNSRMFQLASHLHYTLRMGLLIHEFKRRVDAPVRLAIGEPIDDAHIAARSDAPHALMDYLRKETYALSPKPLRSDDYGFEFEDKYRA